MSRKIRTIKRKNLDALITKLENLPAKEIEAFTVREAIERAAPQFISLLDRGYSYEDLLSLLEQESHIKIKLVTFKQYLRNYKKSKKPSSRKRSLSRQTTQTTQITTPQGTPVEQNTAQQQINPECISEPVVPSGFLEMDEENL